MRIPALSIRQPWAWLIVHAGKDIENRTWYTKYRGPCYIHAAKGCTVDEYNDAIHWAIGNGAIGEDTQPDYRTLARGGIIGRCDIADCVERSNSRWFCGPYGFLLLNVRPVEFTPCRGALGFFLPGVSP